MKKFLTLLLALTMVLTLFAGCRMGGDEITGGTDATNPSTNTQPSTQPTQTTTEPSQPDELGGNASTSSAKLLSAIWETYAEEERFASYGGTVEHSVADAPGDLDMSNTEELTSKYLLPESTLANIESGASLVHLMNSNIFTAAAFGMKDGADIKAEGKALRDNLQKTQWICGQPDRLLIVQADGHLLMAFGAKDAMDTFRQRLSGVYADASILYDEAVTA